MVGQTLGQYKIQEERWAMALLRQALAESLLLAVMGGAMGLLVAMELAQFLIRLAFPAVKYIGVADTVCEFFTLREYASEKSLQTTDCTRTDGQFWVAT
jgi:hypothetical protein